MSIPHTGTDILKKSNIPHLNWQYAISLEISIKLQIRIHRHMVWHQNRKFITKKPSSPSQSPTPATQNVGCQKKIISVKLHLSENPFPSALSVQLCTGLKASGRPIIPTFHHPNPHRRMMKTPENNTRGVKVAQGQIWVTSFFLRIYGTWMIESSTMVIYWGGGISFYEISGVFFLT